jgi:dihydrodipicolinate synthase/N-acetylneuraminate lyase
VSPGLETLRLLTSEGVNCCRIVGSDSAVGPALVEGVNDGVVSGGACVLPELIQRVFAASISEPNSAEFRAANADLEAFIEKINLLPVSLGIEGRLRGMAARAGNIRHTVRTRTATADRAASRLVPATERYTLAASS